ncbi:calcium channel protein CCH1 Ecym_2085 [Eremothecium cymbalariae DBVPG|uniref:Calcium-channel protein CCH1 n=1 Tax=Eremothecium cymbalariae (strain CBS 270.75 / DBVPG 7215 / KCTC 17166 / NRRL Y-17582) TaxID=931890 RepID=G8JPI9_ERECY|nr:Hypothetical protein Ecym_2085 [Eremothecium cymbalariae DBVPG\
MEDKSDGKVFQESKDGEDRNQAQAFPQSLYGLPASSSSGRTPTNDVVSSFSEVDQNDLNKVRPILRIQTSGLDTPVIPSKNPSTVSVRSHIKGFLDKRGSSKGSLTPQMGRNSADRGSGGRSFDVSSMRPSCEVPRSAKVISMIEDHEVDDFLNLQGEFINALEEENDNSWLPKHTRLSSMDDDSGLGDSSKPRASKLSSALIPNRQESENNESNFEEIELIDIPLYSNKFQARSRSKQRSSNDYDKNDDNLPNVSFDFIDENKDSQETSEVTPEPLILYGSSLGIITPYNLLRMRFARFLMGMNYRVMSQLLLILFTFFISYRQYNMQASGTLGNYSNWSDIAIFLCNCIFTIEMAIKIIAFGFWDDSQLFDAYKKEYTTVWQQLGVLKFYRSLEAKYGSELMQKLFPFKSITGDDGSQKSNLRSSMTFVNSNEQQKLQIPRAAMRNSWNRMDFLSTVCFWISFMLSFKNYDLIHRIRIFKTLSVLRILRLTDTDSGVSSILKSIKYGLPQLFNVGFMLLYFWVFFAILGVQNFQGSFRRQCVWINPNDPADTFLYDKQFCGGYIDAVTGEPRPYIFADNTEAQGYKGFLCPPNSKCISNQNPYNGRISFDNIINSIEMIFVIMSANTFTDLMYFTMDSDNMAAAIFFIFSTFFLTVWMMNLFVAVLYSSFEIANEMIHERRTESRSMQNIVVRKLLHYGKMIKTKANASVFPNVMGKIRRIYDQVEWVFVLVIFADLIAQATITAWTTTEKIHALLRIERIVSLLLLFESIIRIAIYFPVPWKFLAKPNYVYDLICAIISVIITQPNVPERLGQTYNWLCFFQVSRFYRFVVALSITRNLWKRVLGNALMIWNLSAFYFLLLFLVSLIVSVYFEGTVSLEQLDEEPFGMYSLLNTFLSLFIIGSTENWTDILYLLQQESPTSSYAFFGTCLIIMWFILANSVVLNIFIAVISQSLKVEESDKRKLQIRHYLEHVYPERIKLYKNASLLSRIKKKLLGREGDENSRDFHQFMFRGTAILAIAQNYEELKKNPETSRDESRPIRSIIKSYWQRLLKKFKFTEYIQDNPFFRKPEVVFGETNDLNEPKKKFSLQLNDWEEEKLEFLRSHPMFNYSYFIIPPNNALRKFCQTIVQPSVGKRTDGVVFYEDTTNVYGRKKYFYHIKRDTFVALTFVSTILMVMFSCYVTPLYRNKFQSDSWSWLNVSECVFVALFTLEFLVKTIADGFLYSPNAYILNPWNCIDLVVLISMWIDFLSWLKNDGKLARVFRGLDALRALRFLTISNTARTTFKQVFFDGITKIAGACLIALSLLFPFTVWGLSLFRGRLGVCNDGGLGMDFCYNEYSQTVGNWDVLMPRVYSPPVLHMDSFVSAFRSLYEIVSLEGWIDLLSNLMNSTGVGTPASSFASSENAVFLVSFNFLSMVFILTLFISFIIGNHAKTTGSAFLTVEEKAWLEIKKLLSRVKPETTPNLFTMSPLRQFCYKLAVERRYFWYTVAFQVVLYAHILTLLLRTYNESFSLNEYANITFMTTTSLFLVHEIIYMLGKGFKLLRSNSWDVLRILIILVSFSLNIIQLYFVGPVLGFTNIQAVFQLIIFIFVIPQNDILSELINTAVASLPSILSLIYTWGILFLVYAIAMNQIFGLTRLGSHTTGNINFRTVTKSLIVLFRCSFGEGWNYIMHDLTVSEPYCYEDPSTGFSDCGSKPYAYVLMMSWNILSMYIFLNMFISLMIENFSYVYHRGDKRYVARREEIRKFKKAWNKFDSDGNGEIEFSLLPKFMHSFDGPLSFKIWEGRLSVKNLVKNYIRVNPADPYDVQVDLVQLNNELNSIDIKKITQRRRTYCRFVREVHMINAYYGCIKFSTLIKQIPLYTEYNPRDCLGIDEYVKWLYTVGKVDKFLDNERNVDVLEMIVTRWKYVMHKRRKKDLPEVAASRGSMDKLVPTPSSPIVPISSDPSYNLLQLSETEVGTVNDFLWSPGDIQEGLYDSLTHRNLIGAQNRNEKEENIHDHTSKNS